MSPRDIIPLIQGAIETQRPRISSLARKRWQPTGHSKGWTDGSLSSLLTLTHTCCPTTHHHHRHPRIPGESCHCGANWPVRSLGGGGRFRLPRRLGAILRLAWEASSHFLGRAGRRHARRLQPHKGPPHPESLDAATESRATIVAALLKESPPVSQTAGKCFTPHPETSLLVKRSGGDCRRDTSIDVARRQPRRPGRWASSHGINSEAYFYDPSLPPIDLVPNLPHFLEWRVNPSYNSPRFHLCNIFGTGKEAANQTRESNPTFMQCLLGGSAQRKGEGDHAGRIGRSQKLLWTAGLFAATLFWPFCWSPGGSLMGANNRWHGLVQG